MTERAWTQSLPVSPAVVDMTAGVTATSCPTEVTVIKGCQSLELRYCERCHVCYFYAFEVESVNVALSSEDG